MPLRVERDGRVVLLTLDDPERRNAMTTGLVDEIVASVDAAERDDGVGALVVTGAPPAFCSGADVGSLAAMSGDAVASETDGVKGIYEGFLSVYRCTLPTVAAVNGPAVGAGMNLALACDVRIASSDARFDPRFARIGLHPGGGHTRLLTDAAGPQAAAAMTLFGERVDGEQATAVGLVWRCVSAEDLVGDAVALAARAAEVPRELSIRVKASLRETPALPSLDDAVGLELERQVWSFEQGFFSRSR